MQALTATSWGHWLRRLVRGVWSDPFEILLRILFVVGAVLILAFWFVPPRASDAARSLPPRPATLPAKVAFTLVPGAFDLRWASPARGYVTILLAIFALLVIAFRVDHWDTPAMGLIGMISWTGTLHPFPLPTQAAGAAAAIARSRFWTLFWAQPYAGIFVAVVLLAAAVSLGLHAARLRRIWSL